MTKLLTDAKKKLCLDLFLKLHNNLIYSKIKYNVLHLFKILCEFCKSHDRSSLLRKYRYKKEFD